MSYDPALAEADRQAIRLIQSNIWAWRCQECGHKFKSASSAMRAMDGDGCPKCGGVDLDESLPVKGRIGV